MNFETVLLKGGSSSFELYDGIGIDQEKINNFMAHHVELRESGLITVQVASGAVVEGKEYCVERGRDFAGLTAAELARRGTAGQIAHWQHAADLYGLEVTQILATHQEIDDAAEGKKIIEEINKDLQANALPVINENEAAGGEEIRAYELGEAERQIGQPDAEPDNDWLAAHTAIALGAKYLILLSDIDGFKKKDGSIIEEIKTEQIFEALLRHSTGKNGSGRGGIDSKMYAAARAAESNRVGAVLIGNAHLRPLDMILGRCVCTRVVQ